MIEISKTMHVNAKDFYTLLLESVASDIQVDTHKKTKARNLKQGTSWTKHMQGGGLAHAKITRLEPGTALEITYKGKNEPTTISYVLEPVDESHTKVTYLETGEEPAGMKGKMQLMQAKRNIKTSLRQMEMATQEYVRNQKNTAEDVEAIRKAHTK